MQMYIMTRGIKHDVDQFITQLQGRYLPWAAKLKGDKKKKTYQLQTSVRPLQLWEIAFPKEQMDIMCASILPDAMPEARPQYKKFCLPLRMALKAKKIPKNLDRSKKFPIKIANMDVVGIGYKEDKEIKTDEEEYEGI